MPYSIQSYSNFGGSPFQQYMDQQRQNYLQQQQQFQQPNQQQPQVPGMQPNTSPYNQQQYGQLPQYNPLPQYNFNQNQQPQGMDVSRGIPESSFNITGRVKSPSNQTNQTSNPYTTNFQPQQYSPLQSYNFNNSFNPAGGTMPDFSFFNYY